MIFDEDGYPSEDVEDYANEIEVSVRRFLANLDCGPACLRAVAQYLHSSVEIATSNVLLDMRYKKAQQKIKDADPNLTEEEAKLALRGEKIPAIKCYRERTRVGLREAKEAVEAWMERQKAHVAHLAQSGNEVNEQT